MYQQIIYLCKSINKDEWSGILFYTINGSIKDPNKCTLTCQDILLMDKGTQAYTSYEFDEYVIEHVMNTPELRKLQFSNQLKWGQCHSH